MKVKDLIKQLEKFDQDLEVVAWGCGQCINTVCEAYLDAEDDKKKIFLDIK